MLTKEGWFVTRKEEEEQLIRRSKEFLKTAEYQTNEGFYDLAAFSLEQALQLFLKSKLLKEGFDYPRTHSVRTLLEILLKLVPENKRTALKRVLDSYSLELGMLEDAYITSRYIMRVFTKQEIEKLTKAVKEIMKDVT